MNNILKIYKDDIKKIFTNYAALIVFIALSILPSLYAWFNIKASWDPYGKEATSQIKISNEGFDTYTIKETKSPEGYYNERNFTSKLKVYKSINSNADSFVISKIAFYNNESDNNAIEIDVPSTGSSWLKINKDGNRVNDTSKDYLIAFEVTSNSIVITYKNTKLSGQYGVQIKKVNESENNAPVQGVKFKVNNETKGPTNEQGIATVEENKKITKDNVSETDKYEITEVDLGENNLVKL